MNGRFEIEGITYRFTSGRDLFFDEWQGEDVVGVEVVAKKEWHREELSEYGAMNPEDLYVGEIHIPSHISWKGIKYPVLAIGEEAFRGCAELTYIAITDGILSIKGGAFFDCASLRKVFIPASVREIDYMFNPFMGCSSLETIEVAPENKNFLSIGGMLLHRCRTNSQRYHC